MAKQIISELEEKGSVERGWLGVGIQPIDEDIAPSLGLKSTDGALVTKVEPDSPAAKAGVKSGDVILKLNDQKIDDGARADPRRRRRRSRHEGDPQLLARRQGADGRRRHRQDADQRAGRARTTQQPAARAAAARPGAWPRSRPTMREQLGLQDQERGVLVQRVMPNSPAESKGLQAGDVILRVGDSDVRTPKQVVEDVEGPPGGLEVRPPAGPAGRLSRSTRRCRSPSHDMTGERHGGSGRRGLAFERTSDDDGPRRGESGRTEARSGTQQAMRVLVIEDDKDAAAYLAKGLNESGHTVDVAHNGKDGLLLAASESFDALVVDRMLPGLDGLSVVKTLRATGNRTPVLFLSALGEVDDRVKGLRAGGDDYLVKPYRFLGAAGPSRGAGATAGLGSERRSRDRAPLWRSVDGSAGAAGRACRSARSTCSRGSSACSRCCCAIRAR